jgi:hypothetical protein
LESVERFRCHGQLASAYQHLEGAPHSIDLRVAVGPQQGVSSNEQATHSIQGRLAGQGLRVYLLQRLVTLKFNHVDLRGRRPYRRLALFSTLLR